MRVPNDRILAHASQQVDIFLGGHDHIYHHEKCNMNLFIKSGSDFRSLSLIHLDFDNLADIDIIKSQEPSVPIKD